MHNGRALEAGDPIPDDLTIPQITRLQRNGVIGNAQPAPDFAHFGVFPDPDARSPAGETWNWSLWDADGRVVAKGGPFSSRAAAARAKDRFRADALEGVTSDQAVVDAVRDAKGAGS